LAPAAPRRSLRALPDLGDLAVAVAREALAVLGERLVEFGDLLVASRLPQRVAMQDLRQPPWPRGPSAPPIAAFCVSERALITPSSDPFPRPMASSGALFQAVIRHRRSSVPAVWRYAGSVAAGRQRDMQ
jgi:hypothetical protein